MRDFHLPGRSPVFAANGVCASSHPLVSKTAIEILQSSGNAVDAAIGAAVLCGFCEPQMTGIGGDCFALIKPAGSDEVVAVNGSGRAPAGQTSQKLRDAGHETVPVESAAAVTVPGAIDAFCKMSSEYGKLGLDQVLAPAIHYAEEGVPAGPRTVFDWRIATDRLQGAARDMYLLDGKAPTPGQVFRAPGNAEVLRRIAKEGRDGFYASEVAEDMVGSLRALGGLHTLDDFANTSCDIEASISGTYKGVELVEHPPNGQGATAILLGNILSHFDVTTMDPFGADRVHIEAEATKLAYDARDRFLADPDHVARLEHMLDPGTAQALAERIDVKNSMESPRQVSEAVHKDTIYLTVVDKDRMAVSLIYSIFHSFGSGIASEKFGILFQNRGAGFTLEKGHPNEMGPGKRPMHTIIPAMLRQAGKVTTSFGVMGGAYQPTGHMRVLSNMVDFGLDPQSALDAPRAFTEAGELKVERGYTDEVRQELADRGHKVIIPETALGGAQMIRIDDAGGVLEGASDPRKDGCALGY